jgi:hypothetical protein
MDNEDQKKTVSDDNQMHSNPCKDDRGESISLELVDQRIDSKFGSLTRRIDVIEKSLIECTDKRVTEFNIILGMVSSVSNESSKSD